MNKIHTLGLSLLLAGTLSFAQSQSAPKSTDQNTPAAVTDQDQNRASIQGCVQGSSGNWLLREQSSGRIYQLSGDDNKLQSHANHVVEVYADNSGKKATASGNYPVVIVQSIRDLSDNCGNVPQSDQSNGPSASTSSDVNSSNSTAPSAAPSASDTNSQSSSQTSSGAAGTTNSVPQSDKSADQAGSDANQGASAMPQSDQPSTMNQSTTNPNANTNCNTGAGSSSSTTANGTAGAASSNCNSTPNSNVPKK
jgi:hypothetical protein